MTSQKNLVEGETRRISEWQFDSTNMIELCDLDVSNSIYLSNGRDLHVVQKREHTLNRPIIPGTKCEKLTYIRSYVSLTSKTDVLGIRYNNYNRLFWNYLQGAFLKTLPSCYLYLFLGSYSAQHHLFLTKMMPLMHGLNVLWILIGVVQLYYSTRLQVVFLDFIITGIFYQRPWNRCGDNEYSLPIRNGSVMVNVSCYTLDQFIVKTYNKSISTAFDEYFFDPATKEYFQISHFCYLFTRPTLLQPIIYGISGFIIYNNIIWISSSLLINQIFKRTIWKILHVAHWMLAVFFACVLLFLYYFAATHVDSTSVTLESSPILEKKMGMDIAFLTESMTTPPILHIMTSRSKEEVKLSTDSALIITSNTIFYLFRAYVLDRLLRYCVYITNAQWQLVYSESNIFLLWPIFFSSLDLDSIITIPFSVLIFLVDFFTFTITHQFLIEVIVCEWQFLKRWQAAVILCVLANLHCEQSFQIINWLISNGIGAATCTELLIITVLYPLSRLLEDIKFHNGVPASFVAILGLRIVFIFYVLSFLLWLSIYGKALPTQWTHGITIVILSIFTLGLLVKLYDIVISKNKNWKLIFVPTTNWGPFDLTLRLLRKKFDSSKYIASQAPRDLSRHLILKAEPKSYKLDVRYGLPRKSMLYLRATNNSKNY